MKTIIITVVDDETGMKDVRQWEVDHPDDNGKIRAEMGVWIGEFIGKYRYKASDWIKSPKPEQ